MSTIYAEEWIEPIKLSLCVITGLTLPIVALYVKLLCTKRFCHQNLRFLLVVQPILQWSSMLTKSQFDLVVFFHINYSVFYKIFCTYLRDYVLALAAMLMLPISVERLYAALHSEHYDRMHQQFPVFGVILFSLTALFMILIVLLGAYGVINAYVGSGISFVILTVATIFFILLPFQTRKMFSQTAQRRQSTLGQRYQTAENMRSAHLLKWISAYKTITNYFSLGFFTYQGGLEPYWYYFVSEIYYYYIAAQMLGLMALTIFAHDNLRIEFYRIFGIRKATVAANEEPLTIAGERMMYPIDEEKEKYFKNLAQQWA